MNTAVCKALDARSWKDLYEAALFERDFDRLPQCLADAETAVALRARELFDSFEDSDVQEQESLEYALCNLRALGRSLKRRPASMQTAYAFDDLRRTTG